MVMAKAEQGRQKTEQGPQKTRVLTAQQLSERWQVPVQTLANWRWRGEGPRYFKPGGAVRYRDHWESEFSGTNSFITDFAYEG
jgi:hypothetical protein